jgi:hypothetical protein
MTDDSVRKAALEYARGIQKKKQPIHKIKLPFTNPFTFVLPDSETQKQ